MNQADLSLPENFDGIVRLFPLPDLVLFPGVVQALHVFEPRYREMMSDALRSDHLVAMATIRQSGSLTGSEPDIHGTVCIGKILTHSKSPDGRYQLLLLGAQRARVVEELELNMQSNDQKLYRRARVDLIEDSCSLEPGGLETLKAAVVSRYRDLTRQNPEYEMKSINQTLDTLDAGLIADLVCYTCGLNAEQKIQVLQTGDIARRLKLAQRFLNQRIDKGDPRQTGSPDFPPDFSLN